MLKGEIMNMHMKQMTFNGKYLAKVVNVNGHTNKKGSRFRITIKTTHEKKKPYSKRMI